MEAIKIFNVGDQIYGWEIGKSYNSKYVYWLCPGCGNKRWVRDSMVNRPTFTGYCVTCMARVKKRWKGENHWNWKGGFYRAQYNLVYLPTGSPYRAMVNGRGYVLEHRLIMAESLGRPLYRWEIVHHLNGNKFDNRLENLAITNTNNHERHTLVKLLQQRIRFLEEKLIDSEKGD